MGRLVRLIVLFSLGAAPAVASLFLFQGIFPSDDQLALFSITANSAETVTIQTYGYGGGTVNSTIVPSGGFAPTAFLFDNLGGVLTLSAGNSSQVAQDPATLNYDDLYFQNTLGPGTYTLALGVYDNSPNGNFVSDGFVQDGNPGFTCQEAGASGNFCDLTTALGISRTGNYAISISGADQVSSVVPEPRSTLFLLPAFALMALLKRRSKLTAV